MQSRTSLLEGWLERIPTAGGDTVELRIDTGNEDGLCTLNVELLYHSVGHWLAQNLVGIDAPDNMLSWRVYKQTGNLPMVAVSVISQVGEEIWLGEAALPTPLLRIPLD